MARYQMIQLDQSYFRQLREYAADFKHDTAKVHWAIDRSVMGYALSTLGFAQRRSRGFLDPMAQNPAQAWQIPVRRIKGAYLAGWKARHLSLGIWETYNDSREAYYIEFGINHVSTGIVGPNGVRVRVRRPILKLSIIDALRFAQGTDMPIRQFMSVFSLSSHSSPLTNLSEGAIKQTLNAGEGFVYGAVRSGNVAGAMYVNSQ